MAGPGGSDAWDGAIDSLPIWALSITLSDFWCHFFFLREHVPTMTC